MASGNFDRTDLQIIAALQPDGRRSYSAIAEELGLPASSVRYRVQRLQESGMLQIVGIADPLAIGFDHFALIGMRTVPGKGREVCAALKELPETSYVIMTAGHYDVITEVICRDVTHFTEMMTERVQTIPGLVSTDSFLVLEVHKLAYGWGVGSVETALNDPANRNSHHQNPPESDGSRSREHGQPTETPTVANDGNTDRAG